MADYYDGNGYFLYSVSVPGTVGYPINTDGMTDEEIANLQPIISTEQEDDY